MSFGYRELSWDAYLCLALLTLLIFFVAILLSKTLGRSCDPLRQQNYALVPEPKSKSSASHEEIALQEKSAQLPPPTNQEKV